MKSVPLTTTSKENGSIRAGANGSKFRTDNQKGKVLVANHLLGAALRNFEFGPIVSTTAVGLSQ